MDSRNAIVRNFYWQFCLWGKSKIIYYEKPYKGGPVPMWKNISIPIQSKLSSVSIIFFLVCIIEYAVIARVFQAPQLALLEKGLPNKFTCYENANVSFIVNILSMALNFGLYSYLKGLPYASDLTWSKFQFILAINILAQTVGAVFATFLVISE